MWPRLGASGSRSRQLGAEPAGMMSSRAPRRCGSGAVRCLVRQRQRDRQRSDNALRQSPLSAPGVTDTSPWPPDVEGAPGRPGRGRGRRPGRRSRCGSSAAAAPWRPRSRSVPLGLLLAPLESRALGDRQARVAGKVAVPLGAQAAQVGGAPPRLVELRMPAGSAEPGLGAELAPRGIRRPIRHGTQDMRPRRPPRRSDDVRDQHLGGPLVLGI
jgi:hypothetical protein